MHKTLLAICGAALMAVPSLHAQGSRSFSGHTGSGVRPAFSSSNGGRSYSSGRGYAYRGYRGGSYGGGRYYGRRYYLGGVGYFYPYYGLGFGYPYYAYNGYWSGYGGAPYGYGYGYGQGDGPGAYEGRVTDQGASAGREGGDGGGASLPTAVQRQLSKRGYYKGSIDGDFGAGSRTALTRFQKDNGLKATGRIDEDTLEKLGFSERP